MFNFLFSSSSSSPVEININDVFKIVETGDILFFSNSDFISKFIEKCTSSNVSHAILILKNPSFLDLPDGYYGIEANLFNQKDEILQQLSIKTKTRKLEDIIGDYVSPLSIYHRHLNIDRNEEFYNILKETIIHLQSVFYDTNPIDWIIAEYGDNYADKFVEYESMFCSAVCTYIYIKLGLISEHVEYIYVSPAELADNTVAIKDNRLDLIYLIYQC